MNLNHDDVVPQPKLECGCEASENPQRYKDPGSPLQCIMNRIPGVSSESEEEVSILETNPNSHLPLKTPDKRSISTENTSHIGVPKKLRSPPPTLESDSSNAKRRNVSKDLFTSTTPSEIVPVRKSVVARCLYGPPLKGDNAAVIRNVEDKQKLHREKFCQQYEIVCRVKDL